MSKKEETIDSDFFLKERHFLANRCLTQSIMYDTAALMISTICLGYTIATHSMLSILFTTTIISTLLSFHTSMAVHKDDVVAWDNRYVGKETEKRRFRGVTDVLNKVSIASLIIGLVLLLI